MDKYEKATLKYFTDCGLQIGKISEKRIKTPDFENRELLIETKHYEGQNLLKPTLKRAGDPTYNAIKGMCKKSIKKFKDYNPVHTKINVLVIYSSEILPEDIYSVLTGSLIEGKPGYRLKPGQTITFEDCDWIDMIILFENTENIPVYKWITRGRESISALKNLI